MKKAISYILSFILVILIIITCILTIVKSTIMNKQYVISKLEEAKYYERMDAEIIEQFKNYTIQSGLTDNVLENLFTIDKLTNDINNVIDCIYEGKELEINTTEIRENLKKNIENEVEKEGKIVDFEEEAMQEYLKAIENAYESQVSYSTSVINEIGSKFSKILDLTDKVDIMLYIATAVVLLIIVIINIKQVIGLKYISISAMASGLFILASKMILESKTDLKNIMLINQATTNVIQLVIDDLLSKVIIIGGGLLVFGIICSLAYNAINKKYLTEKG